MPAVAGVPTLWPTEVILDAMRAWAEKHGSAPTSEEWERGSHDHPCRRTVKDRFGSFDAARRAAGLEFRRKNHAGDWTREEAVDAIVRWRFRTGKLPRRTEWDIPHEGFPSAHRIDVLFGSWSGGLIAAGYRPTHMRLSRHEARARMAAVTKRAA